MSMGWSGAAPSPHFHTIPALLVRCGCGHGKTLSRNDLAGLVEKGIVTTHQLRPRLKCSVCEAKDGLELVPVLRG